MEETKKKKNGFQSFLPDDVLFNLFLPFPAKTLHQVMRYVCKQWYNVITDPIFVNTHLQRSTTGLFVRNLYSSNLTRFMEIGKGVITMEHLKFWVSSQVMGCCDGLILYLQYKHVLYVANPVTYERMTLPKPPMFIGIDCAGAIARCPSTGRFKVLHTYYDRKYILQCKIITVGVDKEWRPVNNAQNFTTAGQLLGVGGFFYQVSSELPYIVSLDLGDETVSQFPVPKELEFMRRCFYRAMGNFLSATNICYDSQQLDVWAVTDCKKGIWTKVYKINLEAHDRFGRMIFLYNNMVVLDWVDNGNVVIFSIPETYGSKEMYITQY